MNESRILEAIDAKRDELVGLAQTLLRRPSENPPGGEREVAEALKEVIDRYSLGDTITIASDPERPSVITTLKGQGSARGSSTTATPTSYRSERMSAPCGAPTPTARRSSTVNSTAGGLQI